MLYSVLGFGESGIRAEYFDYGTKVLLSHVETEQPFATLTFKKEVMKW